MPIIESGTGSGVKQTIDATSLAGRVTSYDASGNIGSPADGGALVVAHGGQLISARDYKIARGLRATPDGALQVADETLLTYDAVEGSAVDTNKWLQTVTTMTIAQVPGVITLNNSAITTTTTGAMLTSQKMYPYIFRAPLIYRERVRYSATAANTVIELGFGAPATATATAIGNGAVWRKDTGGQWIPVVSINGSEISGTPVSDATFRAAVAVTDWFIAWVMVEDTRATFQLWTQAGALVNRTVVDFATGIVAQGFAATHLQGMRRVYNSGAAGAAVQLFLSGTAYYMTDVGPTKSWREQMAGMGYGSLTSPTTYAQLANYANSAAPASATLSNTTAGYTTLGGQFQWAAVAGAETDYALFGFTNPTPYALCVTRVRIQAWNMGAAAAATPTLLQWGLGFNSSAVSLATGAPNPPMRKTIGMMQLVASAAIGIKFDPEVEWEGIEWVMPGKFFHIILKSLVSAATASEIIRGVAEVGGYIQ